MTTNELPLLQRLQVEPTSRCNCRCTFCRRTHWKRNTGDMSVEKFRRLLDEVAPVGRLHLQGQGEPLLHLGFVDMVTLAKERCGIVGTTTNASLLSHDYSVSLLAAGINRINISLDTTDPEMYQATRPGASLKTVLANIERLATTRVKAGYDTVLAIAVVAKSSTTESLSRLVNLAGSLGLDEVYVQNLNYDFLPGVVNASEKIEDSSAALASTFAEARRVADAVGVELLLPPLQPDTQHRCQWPFTGSYITWDGFVVPCCLQPDPEKMNFGNVFKEGLVEILESRRYREFREQSEQPSASICLQCPDRHGQMWHPEAAPFRRTSEASS